MFDTLCGGCATMTAEPSRAPVPVVVPSPVAGFVTAGREALAECPHADEWDARTRRAAMADLDRVDAIVARMRAAIVTAEQRAGTWALHGDRDLAGFLGRESRQGRRAGFAAVGQAATLTAMPAVADALVDGPVTATHVAEITRATAASPKLAAEIVTPEGQARVVALAGRLDGAEFGRQLAALGAAVDPESRQRTHDEQRAAGTSTSPTPLAAPCSRDGSTRSRDTRSPR